jgi:predicted DNA-binding transcriptional regulator AlpA
LLSVRQVAEHYHAGVSTIWRWVNTIPGFPAPLKISNGATRWRRADLEAFDASRSRSAAKATQAAADASKGVLQRTRGRRTRR